MDIVELKKAIETKTLNDSFLVLHWQDNDFIVNEYIKEIARYKNLEIVSIDSLKECHSFINSFFGETMSNSLYVMRVDTFESDILDFSDFKNVIVVCHKVPDTVRFTLTVNNNYVEFPKQETWQILDYMKLRCPEMSEEELQWLEKVTNENIYKIDSELDKLSIFEGNKKREVFRLLNEEGGYSDLSSNTFFDFVNALKVKDKNKLIELFTDIDNMDVEPTGIVTLMSNEIKKIINVKQDTKSDYNAVNMSEKQYMFYKRNIASLYTNNELTNIYKFLMSIDYKLKSGELGNITMNRDTFIDYIVCGLLSCN